MNKIKNNFNLKLNLHLLFKNPNYVKNLKNIMFCTKYLKYRNAFIFLILYFFEM